jgi:bifunctional DNA-binding transcriptional regulator/antitoxin component of YhaV-PrlF toxin-antitoxin module
MGLIMVTVTVQEDENGDAFIVLPDEILEEAGLKEGDTVVWKQLNDTSWSLSKKDPTG